MRVLCCGSSDFDNISMVVDRLIQLPPDTIVIEGEAIGADTLCKIVALRLGLQIEPYEPDWSVSKRAGMWRNTEMLHDGKPDLVIAFRKRRNSRGTNDTLFKASQLGIPTEIHDDF